MTTKSRSEFQLLSIGINRLRNVLIDFFLQSSMKINTHTHSHIGFIMQTKIKLTKKKNNNLSIAGKSFVFRNSEFSTLVISTIWSFDIKSNTFETETFILEHTVYQWMIDRMLSCVIVLLQYELTTRWNQTEYLACDYERILKGF